MFTGRSTGEHAETAATSRSMMVALAMPPPSHIVCSAVAAVALLERVDQRRHDARAAGAQRVADRDRAAVDVRLGQDRRRSSRLAHDSTTGANASLTSNRSMSDSVSPARASTFSVAGMTPVSMYSGSEPTTVVVWMRASGCRPSRRADRAAGDHHRGAAVGQRRRVARRDLPVDLREARRVGLVVERGLAGRPASRPWCRGG